MIRSTVTWFLALLMPFQVLTAVYLDVRGPAHVHAGNHHHHHQHGVEHHHHHPHDPTVVKVGDHAPFEFFALKRETSGWSGVMLAAVLASGILLLLAKAPGGLAPRPEPRLHSRVPGRLERPPRIVAA